MRKSYENWRLGEMKFKATWLPYETAKRRTPIATDFSDSTSVAARKLDMPASDVAEKQEIELFFAGVSNNNDVSARRGN